MTNTDQKVRAVYVRLTEAEHARLARLAEIDRRDMSHIVRVAVEQYLNRRKAA